MQNNAESNERLRVELEQSNAENNARLEEKLITINTRLEQNSLKLEQNNSQLEKITEELRSEVHSIKVTITENRESLDIFMAESNARFQKNEESFVGSMQ